MNPEEKKTLTETLELVEENNTILKKMLRAQRLSTFIAVAKWVVIIGASVGAYYLFQPILDQLTELYSGFDDIYKSAGSILQNL